MERTINFKKINQSIFFASAFLIMTIAFITPAHAGVVVSTAPGAVYIGGAPAYGGYGYYGSAYRRGYGYGGRGYYGAAYHRGAGYGYHSTAYRRGGAYNRGGAAVHRGRGNLNGGLNRAGRRR